jgi:DNA-binding protein HU-beta
MNKDELSKLVGEKLDKSPIEVKESLEIIFKTIKEQLTKGEAVKIVGFGKFNVKKRKARMGRDPNTGEKLFLPETDTPSFSPSKNLTKSVKGKKK